MRWTEGSADRVIDKHRPRRRDFAHDVEGGADYQSSNAARFDTVSYETDGLVAKRSIGHEQGEIHRGFLELSSKERCQLVFEFLRLANAAHEREMIR
jgi:hypothetical protein